MHKLLTEIEGCQRDRAHSKSHHSVREHVYHIVYKLLT